MSKAEASVILASRNTETGDTLTTVQLRYWRAIHAELLTHRVFSRNAGSSRAIPVRKVLAQVWSDPAGPIHWGANQAGMQANTELAGFKLGLAKKTWRAAGKVACVFAWAFMKVGLHKQVANRILEPWQYINVLVSSTEWSNFFALRNHEDAQPEIRALAVAILEAMEAYPVQALNIGEWHIPYISEDEKVLSLAVQLKLSTARCARISYEPFDGNASVEKEIDRHDSLVGSRPIHASPTEHQATAVTKGDTSTANFHGFMQYRKMVETLLTP